MSPSLARRLVVATLFAVSCATVAEAEQQATKRLAASTPGPVAASPSGQASASPLASLDAWVCGAAQDSKRSAAVGDAFRPEMVDPEAPWAAKLEIIEERFEDGAMTVSNCSAAVIAPGWLVTAAHCVGQEGWISVRATLGARDSDDPKAVRRTVASAICHERFDPRNLAFDVALLKLNSPAPANFPNLRLASAKEIESLSRGDAALSAGWGRVAKKEISRNLRKAHVEVVNPARSGDAMIVAAPTKHEDSLCVGESGAPLVADLGSGPALFGVFSSVDAYYDARKDEMVELCHGFEARSYFTSLRGLRHWIKRVIDLCERDPSNCLGEP